MTLRTSFLTKASFQQFSLFISNHSLLVIFIGDSNVGKTSIMNRILDKGFNEEANITLGVDYKSRMVKASNGDSIKVNM